MSEKVKISTISVEVGKKKLELSVEEAKQLKSVLEEIFGKSTEVKIVEREVHHDWHKPYITWPQIYYSTGTNIPYKRTEIMCDASKSLLSCRAEIK